jgi:hypothetical protein
MSLPEEQENALSLKMSQISIQPNSNPNTDCDERLGRAEQQELLEQLQSMVISLDERTTSCMSVDKRILYKKWRSKINKKKKKNFEEDAEVISLIDCRLMHL